MEWRNVLITRTILLHCLALCISNMLYAQETINVLVKVYDSKLNVSPNIELVLNEEFKLKTDEKGQAFINVPAALFPPSTIDVPDDSLEAESWNYSKGTLEVILRKKKYKRIDIKLVNQENEGQSGVSMKVALANLATYKSNQNGLCSVVLPVITDINEKGLFTFEDYKIVSQKFSENQGTIVISKILQSPTTTTSSSTIPQIFPKPVETKKMDSRNELSMEDLDSITSLTVLYSLIKKMNYEELDTATQRLLDSKFTALSQVSELSSKMLQSPLAHINDSTLLYEDLEVIKYKIEYEKGLMGENLEYFEKAANMIELKLEDGGKNLNADERDYLINLLNELRNMLKENEEQFYRNNTYFTKRVETLQMKIADIFELEDELFRSELTKKNFRQIIIMSGIILLGLAAIIFFLKFVIRTLREQKNRLAEAKDEIEHINANLENLVNEKTKSLQRINSELDTFQYRSSHNLKRPVTTIKGLVTLAKMTLKGEAIELFEKVSKTASEMDNMLDKLTSVNYINNPKDLEKIVLDELIDKLLAKIPDQVGQYKIQTNVSISRGIILNSHPIVLEVLLYNLIENAIFYSTFSRQENPKIAISVVPADLGKIKISIRDNGCGVDPNIQDKIWDMFFVGNENSAGDGLGLYIVKKAVEVLGGSIEVKTELNEFSEFVIILPTLVGTKKSLINLESDKVSKDEVHAE